jgi:hypothetical protein
MMSKHLAKKMNGNYSNEKRVGGRQTAEREHCTATHTLVGQQVTILDGVQVWRRREDSVMTV